LILLLNFSAYAQSFNRKFEDNHFNKSETKINQKDKEIMVPYIKTFSEKSGNKDLQMTDNYDNIKTVLSGLKKEYLLPEIIVFLKKNKKTACEIGMVCLSSEFNYTGKQIHRALIEAGFSLQDADNAVPKALRDETQGFVKNLNVDNSVLRDLDLFLTDTSSSKEFNAPVQSYVHSNSSVEYRNDLDRKRGFTGLGAWDGFQDSRYDSLKR